MIIREKKGAASKEETYRNHYDVISFNMQSSRLLV